MTHLNPNDNSDPVDKALRRKIRRTSPGFEARFSQLRNRLQKEKETEKDVCHGTFFSRFNRLAWAAGAVAAGITLAWLWLAPPQTITGFPEEFAEERLLIEDPLHWDNTLADALVLLNEANLETLIFFAYEK